MTKSSFLPFWWIWIWKKSLKNQNFNQIHHKILIFISEQSWGHIRSNVCSVNYVRLTWERSHDSQKHINTETWFLMINDSDVVERKLLFEPTQIHQVLNVFLWILWLDKVWFHEFYEIFVDAFNIILILRSFS